MQDPGRRPDRVWPRGRPVRWRGVAGNVALVMGRWRIVLAPLLTLVALALAPVG